MSDPVVSNVRMTGRALPEPREGLPPCIKLVTLEDRFAVWHDSRGGCVERQYRFTAGAAFISGWRSQVSLAFGIHDTVSVPIPYTNQRWMVSCHTDDPAEAQAAFERGAEWVRTGDGP